MKDLAIMIIHLVSAQLKLDVTILQFLVSYHAIDLHETFSSSAELFNSGAE